MICLFISYNEAKRSFLMGHNAFMSRRKIRVYIPFWPLNFLLHYTWFSDSMHVGGARRV